MQIVAGANPLSVTMVLLTGTLSGVVTDSVTGAAIAGVTVSLTGVSTTTDSSGNFSITGIPPGTYVVTFTKAGYQTLTK